MVGHLLCALNRMDVIELLSSDEEGEEAAAVINANTFSLDSSTTTASATASKEEDDDDDVIFVDNPPTKLPPPPPVNNSSATAKRIIENPYAKKRKSSKLHKEENDKRQIKKQSKQNNNMQLQPERELQSGLVFEEDVDHIQQSRSSASGKASLKQSSLKKKSGEDENNENDGDNDDNYLSNPSSAQEYADHQYTTRVLHHLPPILYHDTDFVAGNPGTIDGIHKVRGKSTKNKQHEDNALSFSPPKCRCRPPILCTLDYSTRDGPNFGRPFHTCSKKKGGCGHFSWAFNSYMMQWYRFGPHNGHALVNPGGFKAEDLVQGKVGDCWFLSALAVVAEREDLISRLIGSNVTKHNTSTKEGGKKSTPSECGVIEVTLFEDGWWKRFVLDDFLPCFIDHGSEKIENQQLQLALQQSLADAGIFGHQSAVTQLTAKSKQKRVTSKFDPNSIPDENYNTLAEVRDFLQSDQFKKNPTFRSNKSDFLSQSLDPLSRKPAISDLAYSKTRNNQLWVQFIEKAYAKMHGSYKSISGGHVAEAFLDLTGAPTIGECVCGMLSA